MQSALGKSRMNCGQSLFKELFFSLSGGARLPHLTYSRNTSFFSVNKNIKTFASMGSDYILVTQTGRESAVKLHFLSYLLCLMFCLLW